uniref:Uncharacterized protein n=1 Tax=Heterosigma akashiwo TaxID=2829 RepID=A0A7S4D8H4_HETAK
MHESVLGTGYSRWYFKAFQHFISGLESSQRIEVKEEEVSSNITDEALTPVHLVINQTLIPLIWGTIFLIMGISISTNVKKMTFEVDLKENVIIKRAKGLLKSESNFFGYEDDRSEVTPFDVQVFERKRKKDGKLVYRVYIDFLETLSTETIVVGGRNGKDKEDTQKRKEEPIPSPIKQRILLASSTHQEDALKLKGLIDTFMVEFRKAGVRNKGKASKVKSNLKKKTN